ncbi:hypothetical protein FQZ97_1101990 [compost metagenome]
MRNAAKWWRRAYRQRVVRALHRGYPKRHGRLTRLVSRAKGALATEFFRLTGAGLEGGGASGF